METFDFYEIVFCLTSIFVLMGFGFISYANQHEKELIEQEEALEEACKKYKEARIYLNEELKRIGDLLHEHYLKKIPDGTKLELEDLDYPWSKPIDHFEFFMHDRLSRLYGVEPKKEDNEKVKYRF